MHGPVRVVENVDTLFSVDAEVSNALSLQEWPVAQRVFRYTLEQPLSPGEYALTQTNGVRGQDADITLYVWDFGVDPGVGAGAPAAPKKSSERSIVLIGGGPERDHSIPTVSTISASCITLPLWTSIICANSCFRSQASPSKSSGMTIWSSR